MCKKSSCYVCRTLRVIAFRMPNNQMALLMHKSSCAIWVFVRFISYNYLELIAKSVLFMPNEAQFMLTRAPPYQGYP